MAEALPTEMFVLLARIVDTPMTDVPPDGVAISSKSTFGSGVVSLRVVTVTVWVAWPAANVTVPEAAV